MKILIVDDDTARAGQLAEFLIQGGFCERGEIDNATDGLSARDALGSRIYDLLILDVVLPFREGDDETERTAVDLLREISDTSNLNKPAHIIGLTAYEAAERQVAPVFFSRSWVLVRQSQMNDDWLRTISNAVAYIRAHSIAEIQEPLADVVIVTAIQLEMDAVRRLPWDWKPDAVLDDCQFICSGTFNSQGRNCSVVAAVASRMGMVPASVLTSKLIKKFRPRMVAMPGICAGVRDRARLGDVICAEMSWDYQSGKHVVTEKALGGFQMDPHFVQIDGFASARIDQLAQDDNFSVSVWNGWNPRMDAPPVLRRGPVASGSAVLADPDVTERIKLQQRKLLAVEMELYGVYLAAEQAPRPKPIVLGMKSVCDFADDEKSDGSQPYAAYTSATYLREFCERYVADLLPPI